VRTTPRSFTVTLLTTPASGGPILAPQTIQSLVVEPLIRAAVCTQISTTIQTSSNSTRFPIVVADPAAGWVSEGNEIPVTDADVDELVVQPRKLAALTIASNELVADSDPSAVELLGAGIVRDMQVRLDSAYFGNVVTNGPSGIQSVTGVQTVAAGTSITNLDPFAEAISKAENVGASDLSFVAHPDTLLVLSKIKSGTGFNTPLLGVDATSPTKRSILGVPITWSPAVGVADIWAIPRSKAFVVIRTGTTLVTDSSAYFSSDRTAVRCTSRIGFAWPHAASLVKIHIG
jgi:HK97 family phage major capsid protein